LPSCQFGSRYQRLCDVRRRHGAAAAVCQVIDRLARRVFGIDVFRMLWLDLEHVGAASPAAGEFSFRFLDEEEVRQFATDPENRLDASLADQLAAGRDLCFAALAGGRLAAYGWYALGPVDPRHCGGLALGLPPEVAYFYNGFTLPEFRGRRLYDRLMGEGLRALSDRGIRKLLASVEWTNWAALKSSRRAGCTDLGRLVGLGRGRLVFPPRSAKRQGIDIQLPRRDGPRPPKP
jgi:ribosomal protein S18 acetylase RimI-like enzyme